MREVHEGICENHSGSRSLVQKLIRAGYYWPTMQKDAHTYVKACDKCQRFSNVIRQLMEELTLMTAPWPFAYGSIPNSSAVVEVPYSWHRLFHQIGGSRSLGRHNKKEHKKLHMEKHRL